MFDPNWNEQRRPEAEAHWERVLNAIGLDQVTKLLVDSDGDDIKTISPYSAIEPTSKRKWDFYPDRQFVISWVNEYRLKLGVKETASQRRTIKMQWIALGISILSTVTVITNAIISIVGA